MDQNYLYKYYSLKAKRDYHKRMDEVLSMHLDNEKDPDARKRLCARRSHHRRLYRKYEAKAEHTWTYME